MSFTAVCSEIMLRVSWRMSGSERDRTCQGLQCHQAGGVIAQQLHACGKIFGSHLVLWGIVMVNTRSTQLSGQACMLYCFVLGEYIAAKIITLCTDD